MLQCAMLAQATQSSQSFSLTSGGRRSRSAPNFSLILREAYPYLLLGMISHAAQVRTAATRASTAKQPTLRVTCGIPISLPPSAVLLNANYLRVTRQLASDALTERPALRLTI